MLFIVGFKIGIWGGVSLGFIVVHKKFVADSEFDRGRSLLFIGVEESHWFDGKGEVELLLQVIARVKNLQLTLYLLVYHACALL